MRTIRSFIELPLQAERELVLPEMVSNHVVRVLRLEPDDIFHLFNGDGYDYPCRILSLDKRGARIRILDRIAVKNESPLRIHLYQSIARGEKMDWILQKATELGAAALRLVVSRRVQQGKAAGEDADLRKLRAVAVEAAEQSERLTVPLLEALATELEHGAIPRERFHEREVAAPLPRAFQWADGSAYVNHVELVRKARGADLPDSFWHDPLMYQGGSDDLRGARATDVYVCKGGGLERWQPRFTFHGFRYVQVTGLREKPAADAITGIPVYSDSPEASSFECSNPMVNQIYRNIVWGQRSNYLEVPTDCPQRDERLGWTGDAQVFIPTASFNFNVVNEASTPPNTTSEPSTP